MIISKTPLRMSFVGGGSDMPGFYREHPGAVLSTAIDKYVYVTANKKFDDGIRVSYSKTEEVDAVSKVEHRIVRAVLEDLEIDGGIEITTVAEIPSRGSGLGGSSSFTVGLLNALSAFKGKHMSRAELGAKSCEVEIERCGEPIGKQDQYAAAFGGLSVITFQPDDSVQVSPVIMSPETREGLERNLMVFYTGLTRSASSVLAEQAANTETQRDKKRTLRKMVDLVYVLRDELQAGRLESFGEILHENWLLKKSLASGVTNTLIDDAYEAAMGAGATGGKILGAGAGGFLLFYAPEDKHAAVEEALGDLRRIPMKFEPLGSQITLYHP